MKSNLLIYKWTFLLIASFLMIACQYHGENRETEKNRQVLLQIDDSMEAQSPNTRMLIENGMQSASDSLSYYECYVRMGKLFYFSDSSDSLIACIDKTLAFASRLPDSPRKNSLLAYAYNCQATSFHAFHKSPDEVINLYHVAYQLLYDSDSKAMMPRVCANLGDAYMFKNQLPSAASWYRRALFLVDSLQLPKKENITLYMGLASIYQKLNDFPSALKYYQQTEQYFSQMSMNMQGYYLNNYGNYYYYAKDYKASLAKFLQLEALLKKYHRLSTFDMCICKVNMADVYLNLDELDKSEECLREVEKMPTSKADDIVNYYINTIRIGQAVKRGDMAAVGKILASEKSQENVDFSMRQIRNLYLRKYEVSKGNYKGAYENLTEDMRMNDSLEHNRINMRASEIMERFTQDTLQLHHSLAIEHKNADLQKAKAFTIAAIGAVLVIALLFALMVMYSHKRNAQDKMRIMQLRLDSARNRISPHFVFNVLNNKIIRSDEREADELMELAKLIRTNLDMSYRMEVSLAEELEFVKQYVRVEQHAIGDDFEFHIDVDDGVRLDEVHIPSMFVQILVENAFVHGLKGWEGHKSLHISIHREKAATQILVCDNGPGFDARCMGKKRTGLKIISQTIAIVNERNKGKMKFALRNRIENGKVMGCEASVTIPEHIKLLF